LEVEVPKINVYLPDELAEAVKEAGLPVSPICQRALEAAVRRVAGIRQTARLDLTLDDPTAKLANFTVKARTAVSLAIKAARDSEVARIGTGHLLAGILDEGGNLALQVLRSLEIEPDDLREDLAARQPAAGAAAGEIAGQQLDETTAEALRTALTEAIGFGHNYIGCEHLLLGLINEPDGAAGEILRSRGAELRLARRAVAATISGYVYAKSQAGGEESPAAALRETLGKIGTRLDKLEEQVARLGETQS
jgi:ATP-dependent Clp protease ATP-binding subunit ClpA